MVEGLQIKGGADEFEAAVIAVVIDQIAREEKAARLGKKSVPGGQFLSAWVRAGLLPDDPAQPRETVRPD
jgi:hypothetical protein